MQARSKNNEFNSFYDISVECGALAQTVEDLMKDLTNDNVDSGHPFFATNEEVKKMIGNTPFNPYFKAEFDNLMQYSGGNYA